jgi:hypothetical protein
MAKGFGWKPVKMKYQDGGTAWGLKNTQTHEYKTRPYRFPALGGYDVVEEQRSIYGSKKQAEGVAKRLNNPVRPRYRYAVIKLQRLRGQSEKKPLFKREHFKIPSGYKVLSAKGSR